MRSLVVAALALALVLAVAGCGGSKEPVVQEDAGALPQTDAPVQDDAPPAKPVVELVTSLGTIELQLYPDESPIGTANFLAYVDAQFYDGTIFHRVIPGFMIQGGGLTENMATKATQAPIVNEAGNGLKNTRGTLAYARTSVVDSATSQFFVNVVDNAFLDHVDETASGFGYAVFGEVTVGLDVVDAIVAVATHTVGQYQNVPVTPVVITTARRKAQ
jgi:cyclophilin family peptidyl-prolyl cis-trans isomerase